MTLPRPGPALLPRRSAVMGSSTPTPTQTRPTPDIGEPWASSKARDSSRARRAAARNAFPHRTPPAHAGASRTLMRSLSPARL